MLLISLEEYNRLQKQAAEREENELARELAEMIGETDESEHMLPTKEAKKAAELLEQAKVTLTLDEYKELQVQAAEREENELAREVAEMLGETNESEYMLPTEAARQATELLERAEVTITIEEYSMLQEMSKETELDPMATIIEETLGEINRSEYMFPTDRAQEALNLLKKARLSITVEEFKRLQEQSKERVENPWSAEFDDLVTTMPTQRAKEATELLTKARVRVSLEEYRELQAQTKEREENPLLAGFDDIDTTMPTQRAEEATTILARADLEVTEAEYIELQVQSREREVDPIFEDFLELDTTMPTKRAIEAENILKRPISIRNVTRTALESGITTIDLKDTRQAEDRARSDERHDDDKTRNGE
ncbi:MAG: hypothetical protein IKP28_00470 [Clostridia bacterium]|nr:hypothetical protein [Clostridia bacterium]